MKKLTKEFAEAIVFHLISDDGETAECIACNSYGEYPDRIKHVPSCIFLKAKQFLQDDGD